MPLHHERDIAQADWFASSGEPWTRLCCLGPSGLERYCRLFHPLQNAADEDDPNELLNVEGDLDGTHLARLVTILSRHTATPSDCFFGLWDGFGDIHGSPAVGFLRTRGHQPPPEVPPAFPREVLAGPRVLIAHRSYLLFRGQLRDAGQWGAADMAPGRPRPINSPNLIWPHDRAWFVASEIDLPWTGVAGSSALVDELLTDAVLDVEPVGFDAEVPYGRL
jgi:hypothetical protein